MIRGKKTALLSSGFYARLGELFLAGFILELVLELLGNLVLRDITWDYARRYCTQKYCTKYIYSEILSEILHALGDTALGNIALGDILGDIFLGYMILGDTWKCYARGHGFGNIMLGGHYTRCREILCSEMFYSFYSKISCSEISKVPEKIQCY